MCQADTGMATSLPERQVSDAAAPSSPLPWSGTVLVILRQRRAGRTVGEIAAAVGLPAAVVRAVVDSPMATAIANWTTTDVH